MAASKPTALVTACIIAQQTGRVKARFFRTAFFRNLVLTPCARSGILQPSTDVERTVISQYAITKDYIENGKHVGLVGPISILGPGIKNYSQIVNDVCSWRFRMFDADDICYYEGYISGNYYEGYISGNNHHVALDDFGGPNAGCTSVKIFNGGQWVKV